MKYIEIHYTVLFLYIIKHFQNKKFKVIKYNASKALRT